MKRADMRFFLILCLALYEPTARGAHVGEICRRWGSSGVAPSVFLASLFGSFMLKVQTNTNDDTLLQVVKNVLFIGSITVMGYCIPLIRETIFCKGGEPDASDTYQALAMRACEAFAMPCNSVKKITTPQFLGLCDDYYIYVNEEALQTKLYGTKCLTVFHEAVHKKYHHGARKYACLYGSAATLYALIPLDPTQVTWARFALLAGALIAFVQLNDALAYYQEHAADKQALYAMNCYKCAQEAAAEHDVPVERGYLSFNAIKEIGAQLMARNALCAYHAN
jgi:hypothetical protein